MSANKFRKGEDHQWRPTRKCNHKKQLCYKCEGCPLQSCKHHCHCINPTTKEEYQGQFQATRQDRPVREAVTRRELANIEIRGQLINPNSQTPPSSQPNSVQEFPDTFPVLNSIEDVMHATKQSLPLSSLSEYIPSKNDRLESRNNLVPLFFTTTTRTKTARMKNQRWNNLKQTFKKAVSYIEQIFVPNAEGSLIDLTFSDVKPPPGDTKLNDFTQQFQNSCASIYAESQRNSVEGKVARAILCNSLPPKILELNLSGPESEHPVIFKRTAQESAAKDYTTMMRGELLQSSNNSTSLARFNKEAVKHAIKFILSEENLSVLSWGAKEIKLSKEETVVLSGMTRCKKRSDIYSDYKVYWEEQGLPNISRSPFYDVLNTITTGEEKKISAVDYVVGILVNETCEVLQEIVNKFSSSEEKKILTKHLTVVKNFLKHHYAEHAKRSDSSSCGTHGLEYGLRKPTQEDLDIPVSDLPSVNCEACKFVDFFIWEMLEMLEQRKRNCDRNLRVSIVDAIQFVKDTDEKFVCFMQHRMRVANSEQSLAEIEKDMATKCKTTKEDCTQALAIIDWKMKFNTDAARQTTEEHFGKRGISWHGLLLIFYCYDENEDKAVRHTSYIDQIQEGSNLQSGPHCLSMLEAAMVEIGESVPQLKSIILQSDNAGCYHHKMMKLGPLLLNETLRVKISRYTHTETQAGKSLLDAHFGRCRVFLDRYLTTAIPNVITRIATACGLAKALAWRGGIKNSAVQLIRHDSICLEELEQTMAPIIEESKKDFTRCNDIFYPKEKEKDGSYIIRVYAYSNIGPGTQFRVNFEKQTWTKVTVDDSQKDTFEISEMECNEIEEQEIEKDFNPDDDQQAAMEPAALTGPDFVLKPIDDVDDDDGNNSNEETDEAPTSEKEASLERLLAAEEDTDGEYTLKQLEKVLSTPKQLGQPPPDSSYQYDKHKTKVEIVVMTPLGIIYAPERKRKIQVEEDPTPVVHSNEDLSPVQEVPQVVERAIATTRKVQSSPLLAEKKLKKRKLESMSMSPLSISSAPQQPHVLPEESQGSIIAPALSEPEYSNSMPPPGQNTQAPPTLTQLSEEISGGSGGTQATTKTVFSVSTLIRTRNRTLKAFAVRRANQYIGVSRKMVSRFSKGDSDKYEEEFKVMRDSKKYKYPIRKLRRQGHARRSARGDAPLYGATYIKKYKKDVEAFFRQEQKTKSLQYSAADMHEKLKARYPNTFCIPSIHELRNEISSYVSKKKKKQKTDSEETETEMENSNVDNEEAAEEEKEEQKKLFPPEYRKILEEWCRKDTALTPTPALEKLKKKYGKKRNFPEDKVIKARVSQIRGKIKREMRRDLP